MSDEARRRCGRRLQAAREELGLSQADFGKLVGGVEQATVSRWEAGERVPSFEARLLLHGVLGMDPYAIEPAEGAA